MTGLWHTRDALLALYRERRDGKGVFTSADLRAWAPTFTGRPRAAQVALDHLQAAGLVRRVTTEALGEPARRQGEHRYMVTPEGVIAARAAEAARLHAIRSEACTRGNRSRPRGAFTMKLWALLRLRQQLTPAEAAETLVDAGEDVTRATHTAGIYLGQWAKLCPQQIQVSKQRAQRFNRYIVVADPGPTPPVIPKASRAKTAAAKASS